MRSRQAGRSAKRSMSLRQQELVGQASRDSVSQRTSDESAFERLFCADCRNQLDSGPSRNHRRSGFVGVCSRVVPTSIAIGGECGATGDINGVARVSRRLFHGLPWIGAFRAASQSLRGPVFFRQELSCNPKETPTPELLIATSFF